MNITIPANILKGVAVARSKDDTRPILKKIRVYLKNEEYIINVYLTATDSFRAITTHFELIDDLGDIKLDHEYLLTPDAVKIGQAVPIKLGKDSFTKVELSEDTIKFPNIDAVIPKESEKTAEISLNLALLADMVEAFKLEKCCANVIMTLHGGSKAITFQSSFMSVKATALLMPIRS
jgi:DNA polymerase III sliding clamp (beta) subunit (PCNA family)